MGIKVDIKKLVPGSIVEMFILEDTADIPQYTFRFHPGTNEYFTNIVWQGVTYVAFPVKAEGFEKQSSGTMPRPKITVANVGAIISSSMKNFDDFVGAKVTRKRTLVKYLDAANFPGGNPTEDPTQEFTDEIWYIDRKVNENKLFVEFELSSPWDSIGVLLPRRQVISNMCNWRYRSAECGYAGPDVADINDNVNGVDPGYNGIDQCGKRLDSCKLRFGRNSLPFGGFPSVGYL